MNQARFFKSSRRRPCETVTGVFHGFTEFCGVETKLRIFTIQGHIPICKKHAKEFK